MYRMYYFAALVLTAILLLILHHTWLTHISTVPHLTTNSKKKTPKATRLLSARRTKPMKILYWTGFYSNKEWFGIGAEPFKDCEYSHCTATTDRAQLTSSDAVMVHMRNIDGPHNLPPHSLPHRHRRHRRDPEQKWIMYMRESPIFSFIKYSPFNYIFNASMTYKKASDVYLPSIKFAKKKSTRKTDAEQRVNYAAGKSRLVAWFVSNCRSPSLREQYVAELRKYMHVDIFGKCGNLTCPKDPGKSYSEQCDKLLRDHYKFYLSFENSICSEYLTEKVAKTYRLDVVPVVLGGARYSEHLPPDSFINIRNFTSPKQLAEFLKKLDTNDDLYNSYFRWKKNYEIVTSSVACKLCQFLHTQNGRRSTLGRLDLFWNKYKDCTRPRLYYRGIADLDSFDFSHVY